MEGKDRFIKVFANLPLNLRDDVVLVLPETESNIKGPITWNVAYLEINNNTELGKKILQKLLDFKII